jgi:hypothetical protein
MIVDFGFLIGISSKVEFILGFLGGFGFGAGGALLGED